MKKQIFVTQPSLPDLDNFLPYLKKIWNSKILTNKGPYHDELENRLATYLGVEHISLFANGTLALVTALQALRITGEVITTPFSFPATTHALWWNNITPVFVDIEPETYTLNAKKIESAITPHTTAILPVHVYGYPCNILEIEKIAQRYGLKVLYDAAHTFGAKYLGKSLVSYGDMSILSFHATKVFNTFEGGAIICKDKATKKRIDFLKNFGIADELTIVAPGINAKMNEFQAALGILQLDEISKNLEKRRQVHCFYLKNLSNIDGIKIPADIFDFESNYAYFPIIIDKNEYGKSRDEMYDIMMKDGVFTRRYFYPLISSFPSYRELKSAMPSNLAVAVQIAEKVLCLPIHPFLSIDDLNRIVSFFKK